MYLDGSFTCKLCYICNRLNEVEGAQVVPVCYSYFLSGSHDSTVTVWDVKSLMPITTHYNYDAAINDASFSHDSQLVALGGEEQTIKINNTMTGLPAALFVQAPHAYSLFCHQLYQGMRFPAQQFCKARAGHFARPRAPGVNRLAWIAGVCPFFCTACLATACHER